MMAKPANRPATFPALDMKLLDLLAVLDLGGSDGVTVTVRKPPVMVSMLVMGVGVHVMLVLGSFEDEEESDFVVVGGVVDAMVGEVAAAALVCILCRQSSVLPPILSILGVITDVSVAKGRRPYGGGSSAVRRERGRHRLEDGDRSRSIGRALRHRCQMRILWRNTRVRKPSQR